METLNSHRQIKSSELGSILIAILPLIVNCAAHRPLMPERSTSSDQCSVHSKNVVYKSYRKKEFQSSIYMYNVLMQHTRVLSVVRIKVSRSIAELICSAPSSPRSGINLVLEIPSIGTFDTSTRAADECIIKGIFDSANKFCWRNF